MQKRIVFKMLKSFVVLRFLSMAGIEKRVYIHSHVYYSLFEIDETPGNILIGW
mgnify:CR=1 FL=1